MSKILKFPELNGPASKAKFKELAELMEAMNEKDEEYDKSVHLFIEKFKAIDKFLDNNSTGTKEVIEGIIDEYRTRIETLEKLKE
jgi:DNA phosphorothioation-dependent restriction protein DptG